METATDRSEPIANSSRRFARRLLTIGENRLALLLVEVQEERERLLHAFLLGLGGVALGLLAGITFTAAIVAWLWAWSPLAVLLTLSGLYGVAGAWLYRQLTGRLHDWQTLSATLDQLRKDHACLEQILE